MAALQGIKAWARLRVGVGQAAEADALVQGGMAARQPLAELALQVARPVWPRIVHHLVSIRAPIP